MYYNSILISGLPVSGKSTLVRKLNEKYNWKVLAIGEFWREQWQKLYPYREISFEEYWRGTNLKENLDINQKAKEIFKAGKIIGDTRYSIYCKDLLALLVFVTADLDKRTNWALTTDKYQNKSFQEMKQILIEREKDEVKMGQELFGENYDYRDPQHYHLVLNSGMFNSHQDFLEDSISIISSVVK